MAVRPVEQFVPASLKPVRSICEARTLEQEAQRVEVEDEPVSPHAEVVVREVRTSWRRRSRAGGGRRARCGSRSRYAREIPSRSGVQMRQSPRARGREPSRRRRARLSSQERCSIMCSARTARAQPSGNGQGFDASRRSVCSSGSMSRLSQPGRCALPCADVEEETRSTPELPAAVGARLLHVPREQVAQLHAPCSSEAYPAHGWPERSRRGSRYRSRPRPGRIERLDRGRRCGGSKTRFATSTTRRLASRPEGERRLRRRPALGGLAPLRGGVRLGVSPQGARVSPGERRAHPRRGLRADPVPGVPRVLARASRSASASISRSARSTRLATSSETGATTSARACSSFRFPTTTSTRP